MTGRFASSVVNEANRGQQPVEVPLLPPDLHLLDGRAPGGGALRGLAHHG
jgi:hypothetical protein